MFGKSFRTQSKKRTLHILYIPCLFAEAACIALEWQWMCILFACGLLQLLYASFSKQTTGQEKCQSRQDAAWQKRLSVFHSWIDFRFEFGVEFFSNVQTGSGCKATFQTMYCLYQKRRGMSMAAFISTEPHIHSAAASMKRRYLWLVTLSLGECHAATSTAPIFLSGNPLSAIWGETYCHSWRTFELRSG